MADTIFKKIIDGKIPCHKIYENEHVLAFLDVNPVAVGHTLILPKEEAERLDLLSDESSAAVGRVLPRIARAVMKATGVKEYNLLQNNGPGAHQSVFHVHFHIIPKPNSQTGLGVGWPILGSLDPKKGAELARKIHELV
jgi:histidine triad (HIT) family protein